MLASGTVASAAGATVSAWGTGADSSAAGAESSSATAMLGSSPSQDKSVDFLHSTQSVVNQVRLPIYMYYSGKNLHLQARPDNSHSWGAKYVGDVDKSGFSGYLFLDFSCRWLFSSRGCGRLRHTLSDRRLRLDFCHGGGWAAASFSRLPHRLPVFLVYGVRRRNLLEALEILLSAYTTLQEKYSTTLLEEFTS
jgi:hypothetical protein